MTRILLASAVAGFLTVSVSAAQPCRYRFSSSQCLEATAEAEVEVRGTHRIEGDRWVITPMPVTTGGGALRAAEAPSRKGARRQTLPQIRVQAGNALQAMGRLYVQNESIQPPGPSRRFSVWRRSRGGNRVSLHETDTLLARPKQGVDLTRLLAQVGAPFELDSSETAKLLLDELGIYSLRVPENRDFSPGMAAEAAASLYLAGLVEFAQPSFLLSSISSAQAGANNFAVNLSGRKPSDPLFEKQWALRRPSTGVGGIDLGDRWSGPPPPRRPIVAIVDTGVQADHEDLKGQVLKTIQPYRDFPLTIDSSFFDRNPHGTWCAGVVAAIADNGIGITGVAPHAKILPVIGGYRPDVGADVWEPSKIAAGIVMAVKAGADVINLSFYIIEKNDGDAVIRAAIEYAGLNGRKRNGQSLGTVVTAAAGNDGGEIVYPANSAGALSNTLAVGSIGEYGSVVGSDAAGWASNRGSELSVVAPGLNVWTTSPINGCSPAGRYCVVGGTSFAAPMTAGLAALLLTSYPDLKAHQIKSLIQDSAIALTQARFSTLYGHGTINVKSAFRFALERFGPPRPDEGTPPPPDTPACPAQSAPAASPLKAVMPPKRR